jgi:hypothetical protein
METPADDLRNLVFSVAFWTLLWKLTPAFSETFFKTYLQLSEDEKIIWNSRIISTCHSLAAFTLAVYCTFFDTTLQTDKLYAVSELSNFIAIVCGGYFIWDLAVCVLYVKVTGWAFLLHAIYCSIVYVSILFKRHFHYFAIAFLLYEGSTPLLNLYVIMNMQNSKKQRNLFFLKLHTLLGIAFFFVYVLLRLVFGNWLLWQFWREAAERWTHVQQSDELWWWLYFAAGVTANSLNLYWFLSGLLPRALSLVLSKKRDNMTPTNTTKDGRDSFPSEDKTVKSVQDHRTKIRESIQSDTTFPRRRTHSANDDLSS